MHSNATLPLVSGGVRHWLAYVPRSERDFPSEDDGSVAGKFDDIHRIWCQAIDGEEQHLRPAKHFAIPVVSRNRGRDEECRTRCRKVGERSLIDRSGFGEQFCHPRVFLETNFCNNSDDPGLKAFHGDPVLGSDC